METAAPRWSMGSRLKAELQQANRVIQSPRRGTRHVGALGSRLKAELQQANRVIQSSRQWHGSREQVPGLLRREARVILIRTGNRPNHCGVAGAVG